MNVLFVCTGNICRSPMAAGLFAAHALAHALPCTVRSAGLLAEGKPAASGAVEVLAARGVDLTRHRSAAITPTMIDGADLIVTMERRHLRCVAARRPDAFGRTFTLPDLVARSRRLGGPLVDDRLADWLERMHEGRSARGQLGSEPNEEIDDPLGGDLDRFEATAKRLDALVSSLIGTMAMIPVRPLPAAALATK